MFTAEDLKIFSAMDLDEKIDLSMSVIEEYYELHNGGVYVSFSGGKDSTVLLDLVRNAHSEVRGVFCDTTVEFPEIYEFVKSTPNITWLYPKKSFEQVTEEHGFPAVSKNLSHKLRAVQRNPDAKSRIYFEDETKKSRFNVSKWKYLIDSGVKFSDYCCQVLKTAPVKEYENETGFVPYVATTCSESNSRRQRFLDSGFIVEGKKSLCRPLSIWDEQDVLLYLKEAHLPYCEVYGDIIEVDGKLKLTGEQRTGCMFCMCGVQFDGTPNRFQRLKETHPDEYARAMRIGCGKVLDLIGVEKD